MPLQESERAMLQIIGANNMLLRNRGVADYASVLRDVAVIGLDSGPSAAAKASEFVAVLPSRHAEVSGILLSIVGARGAQKMAQAIDRAREDLERFDKKAVEEAAGNQKLLALYRKSDFDIVVDLLRGKTAPIAMEPKPQAPNGMSEECLAYLGTLKTAAETMISRQAQ